MTVGTAVSAVAEAEHAKLFKKLNFQKKGVKKMNKKEKQIHIRVSEKDYNFLKELAKKNKMAMSKLIICTIKSWVYSYENK